MAQRLFVILLVAILQTPVFGQTPKPESWSGTPAENELVQLVGDMFQALGTYWTEAEKITDEDKRDQYYGEKDPAPVFVPKLLAFEAKHPGTDVGLMALRKVIHLAASGGPADGAANRGRQEVLPRLTRYADRPILPELLRYLHGGNFEPAVESVLRTLMGKADAHPLVRQYSQLALAHWMLTARNGKEYHERRFGELKAGAKVRWAGEKKYHEDALKVYPDAEQIQRWELESVQLLQAVAESRTGFRQQAPVGVDPQWYLIRIDEERTQTMPLLSALAAGRLFKETHLRLGKPAPELQVALVSGSDWSLVQQRGKVVIIQFSFKGCGPCEGMYPDLQAIQKEYGERVSVLGIMADEDRKDTEGAIAEGKLTWNITWDGFRGPLATRWAVDGFPTVYVVGPDGQIAGYGLRDKDLKDKVSELLK